MGSSGTADPLRSAGGGTSKRGATSSRAQGTSDPMLARARELHRKAAEAEQLAARQRAERDRLIRRLREQDPQRWSYSALAHALGCSRELVALIVRRADAPPSHAAP